MATIRAHSILASSRPIPAYGGLQLSEAIVQDIADSVGRGEIPMTFHHDLARSFEISSIESGTRRTEAGHVEAWVTFDVEEGLWNRFQQELREQGVPRLGGMSITFTHPLDGEGWPDGQVVVAGDAHHFTDEEIRKAAAVFHSFDGSAGGEQLYQLSAIPELRVVFELALDFVMGVGPNLAASLIHDAARRLFRRGRVNTFDLSFKESRNGTRSLKLSIRVDTEHELRSALDRVPAVLESGAKGIFAHSAEGFVPVDKAPSASTETQGATLEIEAAEPTKEAESPSET